MNIQFLPERQGAKGLGCTIHCGATVAGPSFTHLAYKSAGPAVCHLMCQDQISEAEQTGRAHSLMRERPAAR